jgi:hypothetical protein
MNFVDIYKKIKALDEGAGQDLGDGFQLTTLNMFGGEFKAILDTQSNTHIMLNRREDGSAILRTPAPYITIGPDGKAGSAMKLGPATTAALQKAGMAPSNEDLNVQEEIEDAEIEECGDMMSPMGMGKQPSSVNMNLSMNGSGADGIRDLMNILKNIDNVGEPHGHEQGTSADDILFGVEEEGFGNAQDGAPAPATMSVDTVTNLGSNDGRGDHEAEKVNGGGNPYRQVDEELVARLAELYNSFKESKADKEDKEDKFDPLKHVKNPTKGEKEAAKDVKRGSYADRAAMLKSAETDGRLKD